MDRTTNLRGRSSINNNDGGFQRRHKPDYMLVILSAALLAVGLMVVYSISSALGAQKNVGENYFINKQLIAVVMGASAFFATCFISPKKWQKLEMPLLILAAFAAVAVKLFGEEINGAYRWIQVGGLSFQAAELIKFALIVWLAGFLADKKRRGLMNDWRQTLKPLAIALGIIGFVVVYLQSDLGSAAVMIAIMGAMAFIAGLPLKRVLIALGCILLLVTLAISTSSYRRSRVETFLNPTSDCQGAGYQACQALIAIGSGGIVGQGIGRGVQAYGYLPEAGNDSIFAIYAEKFGFLGSTLLIGLLMWLFAKVFKVLEHAPDDYSRLLVAGVLAWLSTQAIMNIGAMMGLLPLKGITLPFISYGGTSIIFVAAALGIVFSVSRYTTLQPNNKSGGDNESSTSRRGQRRPHYATVSRRP